MHIGEAYVRARGPLERTFDDHICSLDPAHWIHALTEYPFGPHGSDGRSLRGHVDQYAPSRVNSAPTVLSRMYRSSAGDQFSM